MNASIFMLTVSVFEPCWGAALSDSMINSGPDRFRLADEIQRCGTAFVIRRDGHHTERIRAFDQLGVCARSRSLI
jgi:hypothetical protein